MAGEAGCTGLALEVAGTAPVIEACAGTVVPEVSDPWDIVSEWRHVTGGTGVAVMPAVGNMTDDNGDGVVDRHDVPDIAYTVMSQGRLELLSGDGSGAIFSRPGFLGTRGGARA